MPTEALGWLGIVPPPELEVRGEIVGRMAADATGLSYVSDEQVGDGLLIEFPSADARMVRKMRDSASATLRSLGHTAVPQFRLHKLMPGESLADYLTAEADK